MKEHKEREQISLYEHETWDTESRQDPQLHSFSG